MENKERYSINETVVETDKPLQLVGGMKT